MPSPAIPLPDPHVAVCGDTDGPDVPPPVVSGPLEVPSPMTVGDTLDVESASLIGVLADDHDCELPLPPVEVLVSCPGLPAATVVLGYDVATDICAAACCGATECAAACTIEVLAGEVTGTATQCLTA